MRWFWQPDPRLVMGAVLPSRKLNLTQLKTFAEAMATAAGGTYVLGTNWASNNRELEWDELEKLLPDQRMGVYIQAQTPEPRPGPLSLALTVWLREPVELAINTSDSGDLARFQHLEQKWRTLGRPIRTWLWTYPVALLLALGAALAGAVVLWIRGDLSLWLMPLVLVALGTTWSVGAGAVKRAVERHTSRFRPLDVDFRLHEKVQIDRARTKAKWADRIYGAMAGAVIATPLTILITSLLGS